jgi:hypothetical protein
MSDSFCSVSPASVLYSASAQVTIPFTFFQASPSPYSVITQVYDTSNNYSPGYRSAQSRSSYPRCRPSQSRPAL